MSLSADWDQCVTIWEKWNFQLFLNNQTNFSDISSYPTEKIYLAFHLLAVFWLPFLLIIFAYVIIIAKLCKFSLSSVSPPGRVLVASDRHATNVGLAAEEQTIILPMDTAPDPQDQNYVTNSRPVADRPRIVQSERAQCDYEERELAGSGGDRPIIIANEELVEAECLVQRVPIRPPPKWRTQMRTKMSRTASLIVVCYMLCWFPYNFFSLLEYFDPIALQAVKIKVYFLERAMLFNVIVNPFLYGFGTGLCRKTSGHRETRNLKR